MADHRLAAGHHPAHRDGRGRGLLTGAGCAVLLQAFGRFVLEGAGTPAPPAPTEQLVVGGLYRYVRNPMYLALQAIIVGQVLLLDRPALLYYAAAVLATTIAFVRWYEEPTLARRYGEQYEPTGGLCLAGCHDGLAIRQDDGARPAGQPPHRRKTR